MKILCCGFFPALQRTIEYAAFRPYEVNRARKVSVAASGKVTNTARVLKILGADPQLLSFAGGANGNTIRDLLETEQLPCRWIETKAETRICQTLLSDDHDGCTELVENTAPLSASEWKAFVKTFAEIQGDFDRIVFSGTLPPHAPQDIYAELLSLTDGKKVLIDSYGAPLLAALEHRPAVVKINAEELTLTIKAPAGGSGPTENTAGRVPSPGEIQELAEELMSLGAGAVGITQGKSQAFLFTPGASYTFTVPVIKAVNPIGSGDSVSAGTAYALAKGHSLVEAFVFGLACGTSNAMNIEPGVVNPDQLGDLVKQIRIN
ncbi:MAG: PfkB family carbohydrate kinase [Kiritimatiellales bacterium]